MVEFLKYLNESDAEMLATSAERQTFAEDDVILREGQERNALFLVREGVVRIERSHMEFRYEISRLGKGQIFGEMGFVEGFVASADVVADEAVEVDVISASHVTKLSRTDPAFAGRFYHSLAEILSQRLRETTVTAYFLKGDKGPSELPGHGPVSREGGLVDADYVASGGDPWGGPSWETDEQF